MASDKLWDKKEMIIRRWYTPNSPILDVGCWEGNFVSRFDELKYGIDINSDLRNSVMAKGIKFILHNLTMEFNLGKKFKNIFCLEILEHLSNPRNCIKSCYKSLEKGGHIFVSVPYFGFWKRLVATTFYFDRMFGYETKHVRYYSPTALKTLLTQAGFLIKKEYKIERFFPLYMDYLVVCSKRD